MALERTHESAHAQSADRRSSAAASFSSTPSRLAMSFRTALASLARIIAAVAMQSATCSSAISLRLHAPDVGASSECGSARRYGAHSGFDRSERSVHASLALALAFSNGGSTSRPAPHRRPSVPMHAE